LWLQTSRTKILFGIKGEWDEEVTEFEENKRLAMKTVEGSKIKLRVTGMLEPTGK
jgi:hypothetical protein